MNFDYSRQGARNCRQRAAAPSWTSTSIPNEQALHAEIGRNAADRQALDADSRLIEELKPKARDAGPVEPVPARQSTRGRAGLTNLEYAPLCEIMGRVPWAPEVFNCSAPDTGNMETLERYGTRRAASASGSSRCCDGEIRSAFAMTEPDVASSDATNIQTQHRARRRRLRHQRPQVVDRPARATRAARSSS